MNRQRMAALRAQALSRVSPAVARMAQQNEPLTGIEIPREDVLKELGDPATWEKESAETALHALYVAESSEVIGGDGFPVFGTADGDVGEPSGPVLSLQAQHDAVCNDPECAPVKSRPQRKRHYVSIGRNLELVYAHVDPSACSKKAPSLAQTSDAFVGPFRQKEIALLFIEQYPTNPSMSVADATALYNTLRNAELRKSLSDE